MTTDNRTMHTITQILHTVYNDMQIEHSRTKQEFQLKDHTCSYLTLSRQYQLQPDEQDSYQQIHRQILTQFSAIIISDTEHTMTNTDIRWDYTYYLSDNQTFYSIRQTGLILTDPWTELHSTIWFISDSFFVHTNNR